MVEIGPPRLERFGPLILVGLRRKHRLGRDTESLFRDMSGQWRAFKAAWPAAPMPCYGVGMQMPDGATALDYFSGAVAPGPAGMESFAFPALLCAVFHHTEHVTLVRRTLELAFATALPAAGLEPADPASGAPEFIERQGPSFNNGTGLGGLEILVPVQG
jgi:AraC family transcriptional regulator